MTLLFQACGLQKAYGTQNLFSNLDLSIFRGDHLGIIGPNGSGKTSLIKIIADIEAPDKGEVMRKQGLRIGYVPQVSTFPQATVQDVLLESLAEQTMNEHERNTLVSINLGKLEFYDLKQDASTLSGGWAKRLELARALLQDPDILILDEPTNHLDIETILWLENFLQRQHFAYIVVSHDRAFLENVSNKVMELNHSYPKGCFTVEGPYSRFLELKEQFLEGQKQYEKSLSSKVRREQEWLKKTPKARTTKAQSRVDETMRITEELSGLKKRNREKLSKLDFSASDRKTKKLVSGKGLCLSFGGNELFKGLDLLLTSGYVLGVAGPNGCGKTSLLRVIAGEIQVDSGALKFADDLKVVYFDQHRQKIDPNSTLREALSPKSDFVTFRGQSIHVNGWCRRFLFDPDRLQLPVKNLSGGERARIQIARLMLQDADILLLDEPTNDLDIPTLEILESNLRDFPGAVVLITHDRTLIDNVTDSILAMDFQSHRWEYVADFAQAQRFQKRLEQERKQPNSNKPDKRPRESKKKLSYSEKQELAQMEANIVKKEAEIALLSEQLENSEKLQENCIAIKKAQDELENLYTRWEELDSLSYQIPS